jgi:hypothetical protein
MKKNHVACLLTLKITKETSKLFKPYKKQERRKNDWPPHGKSRQVILRKISWNICKTSNHVLNQIYKTNKCHAGRVSEPSFHSGGVYNVTVHPRCCTRQVRCLGTFSLRGGCRVLVMCMKVCALLWQHFQHLPVCYLKSFEFFPLQLCRWYAFASPPHVGDEKVCPCPLIQQACYGQITVYGNLIANK